LVSAWLTFVWLGLLQAGAAASPAPQGGAAIVVVALPARTDAAMLEALHRLRGEATSVGFEVELVSPPSDTLSPSQLEGLWAASHPAAVVTFARAEGAGSPALDVTFQERASGKVSVAHVTAADVAEGAERADVIVAVRAVDFIRARMFDTLAGRRPEPPPPPPSPPAPVRAVNRFEVAPGLVLLGTPSGFGPGLAPRLALGWRATPWLRIGASAAGLGTAPGRDSALGTVSLAQNFVMADVAWLGPVWRRLQPMVALSGGGYWVIVRGEAASGSVGRTLTRSSLAGALTAGVAITLHRWLACELAGGTLWLRRPVSVQTELEDLGSLGRPLWFGTAALVARF
jgi:hypothetical protein